mgnify:CR=1 FL=1
MSDKVLKGGEFLIKTTAAGDITIPEDRTEEQKMIRDMAQEFLDQHVMGQLEEIDKLPEGLMEGLMTKAGEQGLLGVTIPEAYGGFGKDFITGVHVTEIIGTSHSFAVAHAAHTGIGMLPILYFGTEDQKQKYVPKLASGEWKASYCLTEPGSGSDALAAKSKAVLSEDGKHFILNGQKMWITNAGFADVFIVFAQLDPKGMPEGESGFTGFIVEKGASGLSLGNEEHKMGIKGSSTRQVFFSDCKIPKENLLGQAGKGHKIAFNILNIGRVKLAIAALGGAKRAINLSIKYSNERKQFKQSISSFGAIQAKLANQAIKTWVLESAIFRIAQYIEDDKQNRLKEGQDFNTAILGAAEEYAIEAALLKVFGSEVLDYVVDEGVQIFGGYGFSEEYPIARSYRDSRINRIFEGTNEINRLLSVDMLLKRAMKGELDILGPAKAVQNELMSIPSMEPKTEFLAEEKEMIQNFKKTFLACGGAAAQNLMAKLEHEQEIIMDLSDVMIQTFAAESALLRAEKIAQKEGEEAADLAITMAKVFLHEAAEDIGRSARSSVNAWASGDELRMLNMAVKRFTKPKAFNAKDARRKIAATLIDSNVYNL